MSDQNEREAYNEAAREYYEGKEREEMDRPLFTQREMDAAITAAVQAEREACAVIADESWGGEGIADDIRSRGPAPAVDVLPSSSGTECVSGANTLRATSHAVTRDIAQADGAVDSPKVDVMAVVRRLVKAWDAEHKRPITDDEWVAGYREVCACIVALRALVSPTTGEGKP